MKDSKFQKDIYTVFVEGDENMSVCSVAGSGKTTVITGCIKRIPADKDSIYIAFNNHTVNELKSKLPNSKTLITTIHSFGWKAIMRSTNYKAELLKSKSYKYIEIILKKNAITEPKLKSFYTYKFSVMIDLIRLNLADSTEEIIQISEKYDMSLEEGDPDMLLEILEMMNSDFFRYDFVDMVYRPVIDKLRLPKFDYIFVDESQDLSRCQQVIISKIKKHNGRALFVGDPSQSIYGFAGADYQSFQNLNTMFPNTIKLPLSVCYRCSKAVVAEAQRINEQIMPFKKNPEGTVRNGKIDEIKNADWVICRNLKPLVQLNMFFLDRGMKSFIKGVEIGIGLAKTLEKTTSNRVESSLKEFEITINREIVKLKKKGVSNPKRTEKIDNMLQKLEIMTILADGCIFTKDLVAKIKAIFKDSGEGVMLSTIHKTKGLENERIFFLLPSLLPSKFATQEWNLEQERNLEYVAITRAKLDLIYLHENEFTIVVNRIKELLERTK